MPLKNKTTPSLVDLVAVSSYSNTEVVRHYGNMNMIKAIKSPSKSVGILSRVDEAKLKLCITNLFIGTSMYFDNVLPQNKADVIAEEILAKYEYRQLKLEDLLAICIEIKESDTFKLTPAKILNFIKNYYNRREKAVIDHSIQLSQNYKSFAGNQDIDKRLAKSIRHLERTNEEVVKGRLRAKKFNK